jgi:thiamine-phosphate diphosphorylase
MHGLYGIADAGFGDPVALGRKLLEGGVCALQVRCKGWDPHDVAAVLRALRPYCGPVPLLINDHAALHPLADGVHLGQDDGPFPPGCGLTGRSTHSLEQLAAAMAEGVDYVGFGPVFPTRTKDAGAAKGVDVLAQVVAASSVPVVAIGGVHRGNVAQVQRAGAQVWAVISDVLNDPDPVAAARALGPRAGLD